MQKEARQKQIEEKVSKMPEIYRRTYLKAAERKSMAAAIKSFCCECMGYENCRDEIRHCSDVACSLYMYRPYRTSKSIKI